MGFCPPERRGTFEGPGQETACQEEYGRGHLILVYIAPGLAHGRVGPRLARGTKIFILVLQEREKQETELGDWRLRGLQQCHDSRQLPQRWHAYWATNKHSVPRPAERVVTGLHNSAANRLTPQPSTPNRICSQCEHRFKSAECPMFFVVKTDRQVKVWMVTQDYCKLMKGGRMRKLYLYMYYIYI